MTIPTVAQVLAAAVRVLDRADELAQRAQVIVWVAQGRPVIHGVHLRGPLTIVDSDHLLVSRCRVDGDPGALDFVPPEWSR